LVAGAEEGGVSGRAAPQQDGQGAEECAARLVQAHLPELTFVKYSHFENCVVQ